MRNLLALIGLAVVLFAVLGWYLGWYQFTTASGTPGHRQFNVDVNTKKIASDLKKGEEKLHDALSKDKSPAAPTQVTPQSRPVEGQPTSNHGSNLQVNNDGSVTFTLPPLVPSQSGDNPK